jgi:8-oxo-dGTP pyrophosphatase MutT (NUDIX family)
MNKAVCNRSTLLKKGRVFDFYSENISLPNGVTIDMEIIRHPGAAAMVPIVENQRVLLLKQYRYAVDAYIWEIPAGTLEAGEDPEQCARRELVEETGYSGRRFEKLVELTPLPAYSDERIHIYLATGLVPAKQNLDADELLSVHPIGLEQALEMIGEGKIQDAKSIVGLQLAANRLL